MRATLLATLLAVIPAAARAQSSVPGAAAKAAAQHAVAATDAHTVAMSGPGVTAPDAPVARGGAAAQTRSTSVPAAAPNAGARTPIAGRGTAAPAAAETARRDTAGANRNALTFSRETFSYAGVGRRDPFTSLLQVGGDLRPVLNDLRLVTIVYDASGRSSVAILRDLTTKEQYRVRVGQTLGRMRVAQIQPRQIVFTIDEFGYSRQETLMYNDPNTMRPK